MIQVAFPGIDLIQLKTHEAFLGTDSNRLNIQAPSTHNDSNHLLIQAKSFDSESVHESILNWTQVWSGQSLSRVSGQGGGGCLNRGSGQRQGRGHGKDRTGGLNRG